MDKTKKEFEPIAPGIPEALHPEMGNGSLLEKDRHAYLLRTPDPLKAIDALWVHLPEPKERRAAASPMTDHSSPPTVPDDVEKQESPKPKKSARAKKTISPSQAETPKPPGSTISAAKKPAVKAKPKPPKPGKRLRKAAKAVQEQEQKEKGPSPRPEPLSTDSLLTPFTQWLKSLSGSDYVHPYDDDFALQQSEGPGREGISETFADLLAAQGYADRAREMYLRLIEKYPEKSGFFAAKIKALE